MEASQFSSSKESAPYTICCEGALLCGIWHWWDNTAPCCTSKTDGKRCLLLHVPTALHSSIDQEKTTTIGDTVLPPFFMKMQGVTALLLSLTSCTAIILVTTLSSRGRGFPSSENRTNHSCSYNVAEYKSHCSSLLVRELKYYVRPKKIL